jgi:predicted transcriptional regulator
MADADQPNLTSLTIDLLSAYVANNNVEHAALSDLIKSTHAALKAVDQPEPPAPEEPEHKPAVSVRKSLSSDSHIISLIDGKAYQTLKRHLSKHGLTADEYRERYGLPKTYPMVAKAYSESRRAIAEKLGLGRRVKGAEPVVAAARSANAPTTDTNADTAAEAKRKSARTPKAKAAKPAKTGPESATAKSSEATSVKAGRPTNANASANTAEAGPAKAKVASLTAGTGRKTKKAAASKEDSQQGAGTSVRRKRAAKPTAPAS